MENLLKRQPVCLSRRVLDTREECAVSGEFTLPDYCPDIAVVLKCLFFPCVQNRQWSGDQLLVDGAVNVRVIYLDEDRCVVRSVEFPVPISCALRTRSSERMPPVELHLTTKYANCRAVSPRRLEVRGAVTIQARAEEPYDATIHVAEEEKGLHTRSCRVAATVPTAAAEKVFTISEALEFPENLPAAEMLLGGECRAVVRECKLLNGKAIVKGQVYVHQLYTADVDKGMTRCLDYVIPFSQILDVVSVGDDQPYRVCVSVLSDTERCAVGPDGENSVLEVAVKLLVQMQVYDRCAVSFLTDAYHTACPLVKESEEMVLYEHVASRWESAVLPMQVPLPTGRMTEVVDVWVQTQDCEVAGRGDTAMLNGRLFVCILARDTDGQMVYFEHPEEYRMEFRVSGNALTAHLTVTELKYRTVDDKMELQVGVCVAMQEENRVACHPLTSLTKETEKSYAACKATALMYYAQAGESVWDIGNRCHTSPECILGENQLQEERIGQPMVLLVPIAH